MLEESISGGSYGVQREDTCQGWHFGVNLEANMSGEEFVRSSPIGKAFRPRKVLERSYFKLRCLDAAAMPATNDTAVTTKNIGMVITS